MRETGIAEQDFIHEWDDQTTVETGHDK